jgi:hypothetical protein
MKLSGVGTSAVAAFHAKQAYERARAAGLAIQVGPGAVESTRQDYEVKQAQVWTDALAYDVFPEVE